VNLGLEQIRPALDGLAERSPSPVDVAEVLLANAGVLRPDVDVDMAGDLFWLYNDRHLSTSWSASADGRSGGSRPG
jgi:hypothetical protein